MTQTQEIGTTSVPAAVVNQAVEAEQAKATKASSKAAKASSKTTGETPVATLDDLDRFPPGVIALLKQPIASEAISAGQRGLSSIKAVYITERLNKVFGEGRWYTEDEVVQVTEPTDKKNRVVVVKVQLHLLDYPWFRNNAYGGNDNADLGDAYKGAVSDALGKICVQAFDLAIAVYKGQGDAPSKQFEQQQAKEKQAQKAAATAAAAQKNAESKATAQPGDQAGAAQASATAEAAEKTEPMCADCREVVQRWKAGNGQIYEVDQLLGSSQKKYQLDLCAGCQKKRADDLKQKTARVN